MNTDALESFAGKIPAKPVKTWSPPKLESLPFSRPRTVVAVDPSLRKFAAVCLRRDERGLSVLAAQKFGTDAHPGGGYEESLRKGLQLIDSFGEWLLWLAQLADLSRAEFVHEGPPVGGGRVVRPEAALLGGFAMRAALQVLCAQAQPMIQPQTHKAFFCGPDARRQGFGKKEHHAVLMPWAREAGVVGLDLITNEDLRDALSVAVCHLFREPK